MADSTNKLPISIVDIVITKIADFTKEMEILRGQLPSKESIAVDNKAVLTAIGALGKEIKDFLFAIKLIVGLAGSVIALAFLGAQIIDYVKTPTSTITIEEIHAANEQLKIDINKDREQELQNIKEEIMHELEAKELEEISITNKSSKK